MKTRREPSLTFPHHQKSDSVAPTDFSLAWPNPNMMGLFGGWTGSTGIPVTPLTALQVSTVYGCVKAKSEDIGKLPFRLRRRLPTGGAAVETRHPLCRLLEKPNRWMLPTEFWSYMTTAHEMRGNAYAVIVRGRAGQPVSLIPLNPDRVNVLLSPRGELYYNVSHPQLGDGLTLHGDDMLHIRNLSIDGGYLGLSPIAIAQDTIGIALAAQQHGATLFRNGVQVTGVLSSPNKLSTEAAQRMAQSWNDIYGGVQNSSKTAVLEEGTKFEKMSLTSEEAQFLETRQFAVVDICRLFRCPPHKVFDLSDAHYANIESANQDYIDDALQPLVTKYEQACGQKLLFDDERADLFFEFDFSALLRGDQATRFAAYQIGLNSLFMTRNEVRIKEGMNPVPGGDEFVIPLNMSSPDGAPKPEGKPPPSGVAPVTQPQNSENATSDGPPGPGQNVVGD
ncbi:phage portal protein [Acetobacter oeni]|uniref:Portal protein n=1 Tax=Acetobacter oeni TaxID=304077 RepID=A0A511XP83_9PROT|nr:phage portal protein [Acetobacter oeni]MBB3884480.1 HK97 family phage portal protein [Acetobacter oeni]NHO20412.1 phage portal protein [Acetobacter oeni]GBR00515.1 phage major capsid protein HK97 [Acetobacter oeni LMG 21952]GEN64709.1 portal protein [Acetobacter oeni]